MVKTVFVTGASGNTGKATITALNKYFPNITVKAGARDEHKTAEALKGLKYQFVHIEGKQSAEQVAKAFAGVDALLVIPPGAGPQEARTAVSELYIKAAKLAHVPHVVLLSIPLLSPNSVFGKQLLPVEAAATSSGLSYTIVRVPFFYENQFGNAPTIKTQSAFYSNAKPDAKFPAIALQDLGVAYASVLANPKKFANYTYTIYSEVTTSAALAQIYTKVLGKPVKYVQVPRDGVIQSLVGAGFPDWQAQGIADLWDQVNESNAESAGNDYATLTGGKPTTSLESFLQSIAFAFKA